MLKRFLARFFKLTAVTSQVDDSKGWSSYTNTRHDYDPGTVLEHYNDALEAWRKNPIAWRIIAITSDYLVGDGISITSPNRSLNKFIQSFWYHPNNRLDLKLPDMCDELSRSGDLFVILFRNPVDGLSYLRFTTKDRIKQIDTAPNDWETETRYIEYGDAPGQEREWFSPHHPDARSKDAIMLHYAINRPIGALLGEGDLTPMIPWLLRYSRMLEDRVKLNWAIRSFLWMVTVPANKVLEKREQYRNPPEAGSIIIKDESEMWEVQAPSLHAADASKDLQAVRQMIDAGSGYPPHWRGEAGDANLATATAMQGPTERHLVKRQQYFNYVIQDILYHAYTRQAELGLNRKLNTDDYSKLFIMQQPDVSRVDNEALGRAASAITSAMASLAQQLPGMPTTLAAQAIRMAFHFAGADLDEDEIEQILAELKPIQQEEKDADHEQTNPDNGPNPTETTRDAQI
jgi:hypothetical protein